MRFANVGMQQGFFALVAIIVLCILTSEAALPPVVFVPVRRKIGDTLSGVDKLLCVLSTDV